MPDFPGTPFAPDDANPTWWVKIVGMLQQNWALPDGGRKEERAYHQTIAQVPFHFFNKSVR